jgi:hypothetical protein
MPQEYDYIVRLEAEDQYVIDGLTYEQVAEKVSVALNTIKSWAAQGDWRNKRTEYRESLRDIRSNITNLRRSLFQKACESLDPQDIYAAVGLERLAVAKEKKQELRQAPVDKPAFFLESIEFVVSVLKEIDPQGLKVIATNFDTIVKRFKEQHEATA